MKRTVPFLCLLAALSAQGDGPRWLDLDGEVDRQVTVRRVVRKYLGHPTTVLLPDGKTMLCVHPEGHGRGAIALQRSGDAGRTWSEPLPVPASFATSLETPTIHRLLDRQGKARLVLFSGLYPIRRALSVDDGATWSELEPIGDFGGIVAMASVIALRDGAHAAFFHDDGRFFAKEPGKPVFTVYQTRSTDGGVTWGTPTVVISAPPLHLCEPGVLRSPDGKTLAMLLRENSRTAASQLILSSDEGSTWSRPEPLPMELTGDRHVGVFAPDGRLFVSFRDMAKDSRTRGDWVAWVGTWDDLIARKSGQYRVRLARNWRGTDCAYPGVELLPDGTIVTTTYGHWVPGESPFLLSVRLTMPELDARRDRPAPKFDRPLGSVQRTPRLEGWWPKRVADDLALAQAGGHKLVFLGDSITQSWRDPGKAVWAEHFAGRAALNLGVSGDRTQNVLWRLENGLLDALADKNDVQQWVLMIGTNNSNGDECSAEEIATGIVEIVKVLRTRLPKAHGVLLAIFPRGEKPNDQRGKCAAASKLAAAAFADDAAVKAVDLGSVFLEPDGSIRKEVMPDFLHLTEDGYRRWAQALLPHLH